MRHPLEPTGRGTIYLGLVLAALIGINLYVFVFSDKSIPEVQRASVGGELGTPAPAEPVPKVDPKPDPGRWVTGEVQQDDSLGKILRREGLTPPEADELIRSLQPVMDLRKIRAGQKYRLHFDKDGVLLAFEFQVSRVLMIRAGRGADGTMSAKRVEAATETRVIEVGGSIASSLYASIKSAGEDTSLVAFFVDVFAYDINFYIDQQKGDTFRMLVEKVYLEDEFLYYGRVLAAEYQGNVGTHRAFWWKAPEGAASAARGRYYNERGRSVEKTFLKIPLKFARVSSKFNPRRMHPVLHRVKGHWGTDYAAPRGTPVWAAASGKIAFRGRKGGAGNCVIIKHDNGYRTTYMHLNKFRRGQRVGQRVQQKTVIGYVGSTGLATGPHLHFSVKINGRHVDPQKIKMKPGPPVPKALMERFKADTSALVVRLQRIPVKAGAPGEVHKARAAPLP